MWNSTLAKKISDLDEKMQNIKWELNKLKEDVGNSAWNSEFMFHKSTGLFNKIELLEKHLGIKYVDKCNETLPKYVKNNK